MPELFAAWRDLCLLRIGPQDLPFAPPLLWILVVLNLLLGLLGGALVGYAGNALLSAVVSIGVSFVLLYALLALRQLQPRFVQAATGLMAAALLFGLLGLPSYVLLTPLPAEAQAMTRPQMIALLLLLPVSIWSLVVSANIYRHALSRSWLAGVVATIAINLAAAAVFGMLTGGHAAPAP
ncbi:MAG TPA: hypothetical protein VFG73_05395 [Rhodanobacteraceae bacterium]|nr:hypothetical protein [Rhodanobacteraceae bacterium]